MFWGKPRGASRDTNSLRGPRTLSPLDHACNIIGSIEFKVGLFIGTYFIPYSQLQKRLWTHPTVTAQEKIKRYSFVFAKTILLVQCFKLLIETIEKDYSKNKKYICVMVLWLKTLVTFSSILWKHPCLRTENCSPLWMLEYLGLLFLLVCWSMFVDYALSLNSLLIMLCHFLPTRVSLLSDRVFERNEYVIWIIFVLQWLCICACHIGCFMWSVNPYKLVSCSCDLQTFMQESNNSYKRANPNQLHYFWHCQCEIAFTTHFISVTL